MGAALTPTTSWQLLSTAHFVLSPSSSPPEVAATLWTRVVRSPTLCTAGLGLATGKSSTATAASSSYICVPICSVCQPLTVQAHALQPSPTKTRWQVILKQPAMLLTAHVLEHTGWETLFLKISQKALIVPDVSCLLLTPVHLPLAPFLI